MSYTSLQVAVTTPIPLYRRTSLRETNRLTMRQSLHSERDVSLAHASLRNHHQKKKALELLALSQRRAARGLRSAIHLSCDQKTCQRVQDRRQAGTDTQRLRRSHIVAGRCGVRLTPLPPAT
jgi:hypothetical protein